MKRNSTLPISSRISSDRNLKRYVSMLLWLNQVKIPAPYQKMMDQVLHLRKCSGTKMTVLYLKGAKLLLDHYLAGQPSKSGQNPRIATKFGLPTIIPKVLRDEIRQGNLGVIRVVGGILSVFRLLSFKGELKLQTITGEFEGISKSLPPLKVRAVVNEAFGDLFKIPKPKGNDILLNLKTAGPNHKVSILGAAMDMYYLYHSTSLLEPMKKLIDYFGGDLWSLIQNEINFIQDLEPNKELRIGKLSTKNEPAGKIRVFAIVDVWTQTVLEPIHKHCFDILKKIPNDGCFDQEAPLRRLQKKNLNECYSFDLSAATDRFPIDLQVQVMSMLYNIDIASAWKELLVNRDYYLKSVAYRYSVGQPMGALSSWAVFALTHHVVVQYCAREVGYTKWFDNYALLGDDIVICDKQVADMYLFLMTKVLGVEINLSKSIVSNKGVMEFAKRLVSPTADYTPVGPKNVALALKAPAHISTLLMDYVAKGGVIYNAKEMLDKLGYDIVKVSKSNLESLLWTIIGPFGFGYSGSSFGPSRVESVLSYFRLYGVNLDIIDEVNDAIDRVILSQVEDELRRSRERTSLSLKQFKNLLEIPGFNSDMIQMLPSFRSFLLSALEQSSKNFETFKIPLHPTGFPTVTEIVKWKFSHLPPVLPVDNPLVNKRVQRPRFRRINLEFFTRVNAELDDFFNS
nr:MAG: putative RNA dependent RNA polymerase [Guangxi riverbank mitovirus 3]